MSDEEIIKAVKICAKNSLTRNRGLTYEGMPVHLLFEEILRLVYRQKAEIERLESDLNVANRLMKDRERMPIPYDEDEFLRKAILQVIGWIEDIPNYRIFGMLLLTKERVDEWKANIKKGGDTE